jgi:hypothetical protein
MAGYSGTPLPRKLGIKDGARVGLVRAPADFHATLGELPDGVAPHPIGRGKSSFDVIVCFVTAAKQLGDLGTLKQRLDPGGGLWVAWPKKTQKKLASGVASIVTDVDEGKVRSMGLATGLVDNKVCAIDEVWSGLRFVVRLTERPSKTTR